MTSAVQILTLSEKLVYKKYFRQSNCKDHNNTEDVDSGDLYNMEAYFITMQQILASLRFTCDNF
jgi:hypothetical protein